MHIYICDLYRDAGYIGRLTKVNLSHVHQFTPKDCGPCHSDTGSDGYRVVNYLVNLQATKAD